MTHFIVLHARSEGNPEITLNVAQLALFVALPDGAGSELKMAHTEESGYVVETPEQAKLATWLFLAAIRFAWKQGLGWPWMHDRIAELPA
jgi:hypothetical protein